MWKKFKKYFIKKSLVLVRKSYVFYATLYQEVFVCNPGGGRGSLNHNKTPLLRVLNMVYSVKDQQNIRLDLEPYKFKVDAIIRAKT